MDVVTGTGPQQVAVDEPLLAGVAHDYADAFAMALPAEDGRTAEELMRAAVEGAPRALRRLVLAVHRHVLRFRLGPLESPEHLLGWRFTRSDADVAVLQASGPLVRAAIVGRRTATGLVFTTSAEFVSRETARALMALVAPVHRRVAAYLVQCAARRPDRHD